MSSKTKKRPVLKQPKPRKERKPKPEKEKVVPEPIVPPPELEHIPELQPPHELQPRSGQAQATHRINRLQPILNFRIEAHLAEAFREGAERRHTTRGQLLRSFVIETLSKWENENFKLPAKPDESA